MNIFDICQLDDSRWQAKYHGNYGVYTVKLKLDKEGGVSDFSCSCPSPGHPCKHIGLVRSAVLEHIETAATKPATGSALNELLQKVSLDELRAFVVSRAAHDKELNNDLMLKFAGKIGGNRTGATEDRSGNPYSSIIAEALSDIDVRMHGYDDGYHYYDNDEYYADMSILGEWFRRAEEFVEQGKYEEAILICKACIEEFAQWAVDNNNDEYSPEECVSEDYSPKFFNLLEQAADSGKTDRRALYEYCLSELDTEKYAGLGRSDDFYDLMSHLAADVDLDGFIALQNVMLEKIEDKSSHYAEKILERIICTYRTGNRPEKATETMENNLQVESFRRRTTEKLISEQNYADAKRLINDFLTATDREWKKSPWKELLLNIAQKENSVDDIRKITSEFLANGFSNRHYDIYKHTFGTEEWTQVFEALYRHYDKEAKSSNRYSSSAAELLHAGNMPGRLMDYVESKLSTSVMEQYHGFFAASYPERTLVFFRQVVDKYAEGNIGRSHYENVKKWMETMRGIQGGNVVVAEMLSQYRTLYRRRSAMMEILNRLTLK